MSTQKIKHHLKSLRGDLVKIQIVAKPQVSIGLYITEMGLESHIPGGKIIDRLDS